MQVPEFVVKDSGKRNEFASGMVRDVEDGKIDYTLVLDGPMLERWAAHLTKGAQKYSARNWMQAAGEEELARFKRSLLRHTIQYLRGDLDEDHAAAMFFNVNGIEYVKARLAEKEVSLGSDAKPACAAGRNSSPSLIGESVLSMTPSGLSEFEPTALDQWRNLAESNRSENCCLTKAIPVGTE